MYYCGRGVVTQQRDAGTERKSGFLRRVHREDLPCRAFQHKAEMRETKA